MQQGKIEAICLSEKRGTPKKSVPAAQLKPEWGLVGDGHAGRWHRQVSLLPLEEIEAFCARGAQVQEGSFGENLIVSGLNWGAMAPGRLVKLGPALIEITQIGKECHDHCAIYERMGECIMPRLGVFGRVLRGGEIRPGDEAAMVYKTAVLTLSDSAAAGTRTDESGPLLAQLLPGRYEVCCQRILPDDRGALEAELRHLCDEEHYELILTTGGTGFSPRDITPEATQAVAERMAPGIAEAIRLHSLQKTPRAMLSRGTSVLRGGCLIVNLPGSPKAVKECMEVLVPHVEHGLDVLRGSVKNCAETR